MRQFVPVGLVMVGALVFSACQLPINTSGYSPNGGPNLAGETLTNYSPDPGTCVYSGAGTQVSVFAPSTVDGNEREAFWCDGSAVAQDEESCAQWTTAPGNTQQGAMLHITRTSDGGVLGISVMENVYDYGYWTFNFDTWDSDDISAPYTEIGSADLSTVVLVGNDYVPHPWWLCARTIGDQLQFVVWTGDNPRPAYGTPGAGGEVTIPAAYQGPGMAGWYIGHIPPGDGAGFNSLATADNDAPPTTTTTTTTTPTAGAPPTTTSSPSTTTTIQPSPTTTDAPP